MRSQQTASLPARRSIFSARTRPRTRRSAISGYTSTRRQHADQYDALASINGDLSKLFSLPGDPIAFASGGDYRRETAFSQYDDVTASRATFLNRIPIFACPALAVKGGYSEVHLPFPTDRPFFHELSVGGRIARFQLQHRRDRDYLDL